jgi:Lar family restriction alleviation protein
MKPCPFCGDVNVSPVRVSMDAEEGLYHMQCGFCSSRGPWARTEQDSIRMWNNRRSVECQHSKWLDVR